LKKIRFDLEICACSSQTNKWKKPQPTIRYLSSMGVPCALTIPIPKFLDLITKLTKVTNYGMLSYKQYISP